MNRTLATFLLVAVLTGLLAALGMALENKGYAFGALGVARLDGLAGAAGFIPLAALYAFSAALTMLLPLRAAGFVYASATAPLHAAALVLLAAILGVQAARLAFGDHDAPWALLDWRFAFAAGIVAVHVFMNELRRNVLLRTVSFVIFITAALAFAFWRALERRGATISSVWDRLWDERRPPNLILAQVESVRQISPNFRRMRLHSADLARFGPDALHFRLLLPPRGGVERRAQRRRSLGALHGSRIDHHRHARRAPTQGRQHVAERCRGG